MTAEKLNENERILYRWFEAQTSGVQLAEEHAGEDACAPREKHLRQLASTLEIRGLWTQEERKFSH
jgi:hypothetical protein